MEKDFPRKCECIETLFIVVYVTVLLYFGLVPVETRKKQRIPHHCEKSNALVISALSHNVKSNLCQG